MDRGRLLLNQLRIKYGNAQYCHLADKILVCNGAVECMLGGNEVVYSPEELNELEPAPTLEESQRLFNIRNEA